MGPKSNKAKARSALGEKGNIKKYSGNISDLIYIYFMYL